MLHIRYANEGDAFTLAYIHVNSWKAAYKNIVPDEILDNLSVDKRKLYFENVIKDKSEIIVIAYKDNVAAGFMTFGKCRDDDKDSSLGEIWGIYLLPEFWRQGIGSELISWGVNSLNDLGYNKVCLWVLEENMRARKFYEKQGFIYDGTSKELLIGKPLIVLRYIKVKD